MNKLAKSLMVVGVVILSAVHAMANCQIAGEVRNGLGDFLPGATVTVFTGPGGFTQDVKVTDSTGKYTLIVNTPGDYVLGASKSGFSPASSPLITGVVHGMNTSAPIFLTAVGGVPLPLPGGGFVPTGGFSSGNDGKGAISMSPTDSVGAGQQGTWTILYTVPNEKLMPGGGVRFDIPWGWTDPQISSGTMAGFIAVTKAA